MKIAQVRFTSWDKIYNFNITDFDIKVGEMIVAKSDFGTDIGRVVDIKEKDLSPPEKDEAEPPTIIRRVTTEDLSKMAEYERRKSEVIEFCKKAVERRDLPMKIVNAYFSLDGGRLIFTFIASGRIDFRELVKDLTHHFQKSIRLHQLGIRDEAKIAGDIGPCGRTLCCVQHLSELESVTSDLADLQQVSHRGPERLSGVCGRLRCCLVFEKEIYEKLAKNLPEIGNTYKTSKGRGRVIQRHILKQTIEVAIDGDEGNIVEVVIK